MSTLSILQPWRASARLLLVADFPYPSQDLGLFHDTPLFQQLPQHRTMPEPERTPLLRFYKPDDVALDCIAIIRGKVDKLDPGSVGRYFAHHFGAQLQ